MNTLFDTTGNCRQLSVKEVIYNITNSDVTAQRYEEMLLRDELVSLETLFEELTPGRRKVAEAAVEIYKRVKEREISCRKITSSQSIFDLMLPLIGDLEREEFWVILCNNAMNVIKKVRLSSGGIDGTFVDVRLLLKQAIINNATCFVSVHNHPSGNFSASHQDKTLTANIKKAAELMNIRLVDHVIIGNGGYYSFADDGLI